VGGTGWHMHETMGMFCPIKPQGNKQGNKEGGTASPAISVQLTDNSLMKTREKNLFV
jgi:hypothetical protein